MRLSANDPQAAAPEWWNAWGQLQQAAERLDAAVASLRANEQFALARPNLADEYRARMGEVETLRSRLVWLRDTIREVFDSLGVELQGVGQQLGQLGIIPFLVWPIVAAGVAWLGSKALDLWKFSQAVDEQRRLEASGVPPAQAAQLVRAQLEAGSFAAAARSLAPALILAGGIYLVARSMR